MTSDPHGKNTSDVEVSSITAKGVWLRLGSRDVLLPFADFPWFQDASIASVLNLDQPRPGHLHWPDLDVDLEIESIDHPERYPLVSRDRRRRPLA